MMRPAAVLGDLLTCSRRTPAGLLRCHQCQPVRSGRLARVVPATAPTSSPTSSSGSTAQSAVPPDSAGQPRTGTVQVAMQQPPTLIQKPHADTPPAPSQAHAASSVSAPNEAATPAASAHITSSSPSTMGSDPSRTTGPSVAQLPHTTASSAAQAAATSVVSPPSSTLPPAPCPPPPQPLSDSRVALSAPTTPGGDGQADTGSGNPAPPGSSNSSPGGSGVHNSGGSGNGRGAMAAAARSPCPPPLSIAPSAPTAPTGKLNGNGGSPKLASSSSDPHPSGSSGGAAVTPPTAAGPCTDSANGRGDAAATDPAGVVTTATPTPQAVLAVPDAPSQATTAVPPDVPIPSSTAAATAPAAPSSPGATQAPGGAIHPAATAAPTSSSSSPSALAATSSQSQPSPPQSAAVQAIGGVLGSGVVVSPAAGTGTVPLTPGSATTPAPTPAAAGIAGGPVGAVAAAQLQLASPSAIAATPPAPAGAPSTSSPSPSTSSSPPSSTSHFPFTPPGAGHAAHTATHSPPTSTTPSSSTSTSTTAANAATISSASSGFQLRPIHVVIFAAIFLGGALFAALTLQFTADLDFQAAVTTVARRVTRSVAFRQLCVIACAICLVRFGLNNVLRALAKFSSNPVQWDKSKVYYILKEVYQPLELLLFIAAICTIADSFVPQLIAVPRSTVSTVVRSTLSVSFILGAATVVLNLKSRFCKENAWQSEMNGDVTAQRRWEAYDKLGTFVIYTITFVLGIQALGLEVTSVLAIGGIGGLAIGLAGREICENILNGFLIMSTSPFEVGDEVHFFHTNKVVEGMVLDIGWYRTTIRSYEREVFVIPNAVFSKNIVLNITRKNREWRFFEMICVRVQDVHKVNTIIQDIRRIVRNDQRIITKLHRRIFLDKLTHEDCRIYVSFYVEAQNRESFMAVKQDLLLAFVDCVERNGAKLAVPRTTVQMEPEVVEALSPMLGAAAAMAAAKVTMDVQQAAGNAAAAAARAITDGRTITAEVTAVPSTTSPSTGTFSGAGGTTATSGKAATAAAGPPGSPGKSIGGSGGSGSSPGSIVVAADAATATTAGGGGAAAAAPPAQGSSKGEGDKAASGESVGGFVGTVGGSGAGVAATAVAAGAGAAHSGSAGSGGGSSTAAPTGSKSGGHVAGPIGSGGGASPPAVVVQLVDTSAPGTGAGSGIVATVVTRFSTPPKPTQPSPTSAAASSLPATASTAAPAPAAASAVRRDSVTAAGFAMTLDVEENDAEEDYSVVTVASGSSRSGSRSNSSAGGGGSSSGGDGMVILASFDDLDVTQHPSPSAPPPLSSSGSSGDTANTTVATSSSPASNTAVPVPGAAAGWAAAQPVVSTAVSSGGGGSSSGVSASLKS